MLQCYVQRYAHSLAKKKTEKIVYFFKLFCCTLKCIGLYTDGTLVTVYSWYAPLTDRMLRFTTLQHINVQKYQIKGSSQHKVGGEWFEIKLGKISRMLVKYEVLPIPNAIFVC